MSPCHSGFLPQELEIQETSADCCDAFYDESLQDTHGTPAGFCWLHRLAWFTMEMRDHRRGWIPWSRAHHGSCWRLVTTVPYANGFQTVRGIIRGLYVLTMAREYPQAKKEQYFLMGDRTSRLWSLRLLGKCHQNLCVPSSECLFPYSSKEGGCIMCMNFLFEIICLETTLISSLHFSERNCESNNQLLLRVSCFSSWRRTVKGAHSVT